MVLSSFHILSWPPFRMHEPQHLNFIAWNFRLPSSQRSRSITWHSQHSRTFGSALSLSDTLKDSPDIHGFAHWCGKPLVHPRWGCSLHQDLQGLLQHIYDYINYINIYIYIYINSFQFAWVWNYKLLFGTRENMMFLSSFCAVTIFLLLGQLGADQVARRGKIVKKASLPTTLNESFIKNRDYIYPLATCDEDWLILQSSFCQPLCCKYSRLR